jgi:hypothetical protein
VKKKPAPASIPATVCHVLPRPSPCSARLNTAAEIIIPPEIA